MDQLLGCATLRSVSRQLWETLSCAIATPKVFRMNVSVWASAALHSYQKAWQGFKYMELTSKGGYPEATLVEKALADLNENGLWLTVMNG